MSEPKFPPMPAVLSSDSRGHDEGVVGLFSSQMSSMHAHFGRDYVDPYHAGAAVAFGLMGMAEAIRLRCTCPTDRPCRDWDLVCERCKGYP